MTTYPPGAAEVLRREARRSLFDVDRWTLNLAADLIEASCGCDDPLSHLAPSTRQHIDWVLAVHHANRTTENGV